jgi:hypothetical protein
MFAATTKACSTPTRKPKTTRPKAAAKMLMKTGNDEAN